MCNRLKSSPAKGHRIRPGEELRVETVLIDPELDIMIHDLDEVVRHRSANGKEGTIGKCVSLDPKVIITRTDGERIAEASCRSVETPHAGTRGECRKTSNSTQMKRPSTSAYSTIRRNSTAERPRRGRSRSVEISHLPAARLPPTTNWQVGLCPCIGTAGGIFRHVRYFT